MKQKLLNLFVLVLLLGSVNLAWSQSTYKWVASEWSPEGGYEISINAEDNQFTTTKYNWGCCSVVNSSAYKLPKRQTFLVVKGENITSDSNNPKLSTFNGAAVDMKMNVVGTTLAYYDITDYLPSETDFFGNVSIDGQTKIYIDEPAEGSTTITSIELVAADLLDAASIMDTDSELLGGSPVKYGDDIATDRTLAAADGEFKKTLTFTQATANGDMGIRIKNIKQQLNSSDMFLVIESDNSALNTNSRIKLRNLTAGGTKYENNTGGCYVKGIEVSPGHYLDIHSFYKGSDNSSSLLNRWATTPTMDITEATLYINNSNGTTVNIYRLGLYNLSEIMQMYGLSGEKWWYTMTNEGRLDVEIHGNAIVNEIKVNGSYGTANTNTTAYAAQMIRSMGVLPANYTKINLRSKFSFKTDETPCDEDVFVDMPSTITTIELDDEVSYLPTANTNIYYNNQKYFAFKEKSIEVPTQNGTSNGNWTSLTRTFKAGYNSLCVPFNKLQVTKLPAGLTVYKLSAYNSGTGEVTFTKVTENESANTKNVPYIVHAEKAGTYVLLGRDPEKDFTSSYYKAQQGDLKFVGSYVNKVPDGDYASTINYGITADAARLARMGAETKTALYRAFIAVPASANVAPLVLSFSDEDITDIVTPEAVDGLGVMGDDKVYNLSGVQMQEGNLPRGIYVKNGRKFIIK